MVWCYDYITLSLVRAYCHMVMFTASTKWNYCINIREQTMKEIKLSQNKVAIVDDYDAEVL